VPNSRLLENTVVNWTLSDRRVRTSIGVGVAYGSPVARMKEILTSSVRAHPDVLPEPVIVLLEDFAADALFFRVYFWTEIESEMGERTTESDIRCAIEKRCAEAGITIAFPQRDVHLDSAHPIDVRLIPPRA
jgi:potassium-dependent mechanosensitive channel